jgi:excisionase family DNA binding protein
MSLTRANEAPVATLAEPQDLLTSAEVASMFGVDRRTVVLWAKRGRLPALRTPGGQHRFRFVEIERLLQQVEETH